MFVWGRGAGIVRQGPSVLAVVAGCVCLFVFFCFFFVGGGGGTTISSSIADGTIYSEILSPRAIKVVIITNLEQKQKSA